MGRRSDHSRQELRALILEQAHVHMAEVGFGRFSSREVAKRIGYAVGTIYHVYGTLDHLLEAVNTRTFVIWGDAIAAELESRGEDRIAALVEGYFAFAHAHRNLWNAIYDYHLPPGRTVAQDQQLARDRLTGIVTREVAAALPPPRRADAAAITRSLIAIVHGHCSLDLSGSYALMGGADARADALTRVREVLGFDAAGAEEALA